MRSFAHSVIHGGLRIIVWYGFSREEMTNDDDMDFQRFYSPHNLYQRSTLKIMI